MFKEFFKTVFGFADFNKDGKTSLRELAMGLMLFGVVGAFWYFILQLSQSLLIRVFPAFPLALYVGLLAFDGGVLFWVFQWKWGSGGYARRIIAAVMTLIDFVGMIAVVIIEALLGQNLVTNVNTNVIEGVGLWMTILWVSMNAFAILIYELADTDAIIDMIAKIKEDKVISKAIANASTRIESNLEGLSQPLEQSYYDRITSQIDNQKEKQESKKVTARDAIPTPKRNGQTSSFDFDPIAHEEESTPRF